MTMASKKKAVKQQPAHERTTGHRKAVLNHSVITSTPVKTHPKPCPVIRKSTPVSDVRECSGEVSLEELAVDVENSIPSIHADDLERESSDDDNKPCKYK